MKYTQPRITFGGENWWLGIGFVVKHKLKPMRGMKFIRKQPARPYTEGVGIDLGIKDLAIISDTTKVRNINKTHTIRKLKKTGRRLQRQVSRKYQMNKKGDRYCKTGNLIKSEKRLLRINHRLANIRANHVHKATAAIIKRKPIVVCLEDLNVQGMMKMSDRTYVCPHCGNVIDRDFQAALNLKRCGEADLSKSAS